MGPCLLLLGCQGTAREMTHPGSHKGAGLDWGSRTRGQGTAHMAHSIPLPKPGFSSCLRSESGTDPAGGGRCRSLGDNWEGTCQERGVVLPGAAW